MAELLTGVAERPADLNVKHMTIFSDGGCAGINNYTGWGCFTEIKNENKAHRITKYGGMPAPSTNQAAELVGAIESFELAKDIGAESFKLISDSKYVIDGLGKYYPRWKSNGYLNSQGKPIANKALWVRFNGVSEELKSKGVKYDLEWVKGHSGVLGNEWADKLATMGVGASSRNDTKDFKISYSTTETVSGIENTGTKKVPKRKFTYNRMHIHDFLYFRLGDVFIKGEDDYYTYYTGKAQSLDDLGVLAAECRLGIIKLKEPLPLVDEIASIHNEMDVNMWGLITQIITRNLFQQAVAFDIVDYGVELLRRSGLSWVMKKDKPSPKLPDRGKAHWRDKDDLFHGDKQITYVCNPPKNSVKVIGQLAILEKLLAKFIKDGFESSKHIHVDDISDQMFDEIPPKKPNGKVKYKVASILSPPAYTYTHAMTIDGVTHKTKLRLGIDFLSRNELSGILKASQTRPNVYMIYVVQGATATWYNIVEREGEYGIYSAQCSNVTIL